MANGDTPAPGSLVLTACSVPGCSVQFFMGKYHSCCSMCCHTDAAQHTRRCRRNQRTVVREYPSTRRQTVECSSLACSRLTGNGFRSCCTPCHHSGGKYHSRRCDDWQPAPRDLRLARQSLDAGGLGEAARGDGSSSVASWTPLETTTPLDGAVNLEVQIACSSAASQTRWRKNSNDQEQSSWTEHTELDRSIGASLGHGPNVDLQAMD